MYIGSFTYPLSATFIKIALLLQYLRVFPAGSRIRVLCKWMIVITALWGVVFSICNWFSCSPVAAVWDLSIPNARCWGFASRDPLEFMRISVSQAITTASLDFIVFLIPARLYFRPDTSWGTRLSLLGLFTLGLSYVGRNSVPRLCARLAEKTKIVPTYAPCGVRSMSSS